MTSPVMSGAKPAPQRKSRARYVLVLGVLLLTPVLAYFIYDAVKPVFSPCESLFRQTQLSVQSKIKWLKQEAEVLLKPEKINQLSERGKFVALNLKLCCTVLNSGNVDPETFLKCKSSAFAFENKVADIVDTVKANKPEIEIVKASVASEGEAQPEAQPPTLEAVARKVNEMVAQATSISKSFNQSIVKVQQTQQYQSLVSATEQDLGIEGKEAEPNDTILVPNTMPLEKWIKSEIATSQDVDVYRFTTPGIYRDWITIDLQNQSTTLKPVLHLYNADKTEINSTAQGTPGGNARLRFVSGPEKAYFVKVSAYYGNNTGLYSIRILPNNAYDEFEPNQTILSAREIPFPISISANLADGHDYDYYVFRPTGDGAIRIAFENRSTKIDPAMQLFDQSKSRLAEKANGTEGGDLTFTYQVKGGERYYLLVFDGYSNAYGAYNLIVDYEITD